MSPSFEPSTASFDAVDVVRGVMGPTPLEEAPDIDSTRSILLKREDLGPNRSFKWRGALCTCLAFRARGISEVVTASTGNHGAGLAWGAKRTGITAHVVVPVDVVSAKSTLISENGAVLHQCGVDLDESSMYARSLAQENGIPYFEDGTEEAQIQGTSTIGSELLEAGADAVIIPLACGALAAGISRILAKASRPPHLVGVQSKAHATFAGAFHGTSSDVPRGLTFADGLADDRIVEPAFSICRQYLDDVIAVDDEALLDAARELWHRQGIFVEGAAAAPLAALRVHGGRIPGTRVILIVTGGNVDESLAERIVAPPGTSRVGS